MIEINRRKLLLIEDDPAWAQRLAECLPCYDVHRATTFRDAAYKLFKHGVQPTFSVILLDLGIPDGDGAKLAKNTHMLWPSVPIVVITGMSDSEIDLVTIRRAGVMKVLKKPVNPDQLRDALLDAIATKEAERQFKGIMEAASEVQQATTAALESAIGKRRNPDSDPARLINNRN